MLKTNDAYYMCPQCGATGVSSIGYMPLCGAKGCDYKVQKVEVSHKVYRAINNQLLGAEDNGATSR